jgi:tetratricopeptide (TPR) repeat protein
MALNWAGKNISIDEIASQVYTPGVKGTLQSDLISASRRQGLIAIPIEGLSALLTEIAAGHPVIVFENLSVSWLPQWHYAIVFGYDLSQQKVLMHSGPEAFKQWDLRKFERSWKLGQYWGLVVLPPGLLSATAGELAQVRATAALEPIGKLKEAAISYQTILQHWPKSLGANIGLGNIAYAKNESKTALGFFQQATEDHPQSAPAWHNLALAQQAANMKMAAHRAALQALALASVDEKPSYTQDLQEIIHSQK